MKLSEIKNRYQIQHPVRVLVGEQVWVQVWVQVREVFPTPVGVFR
jgi:hypothetical protein